ncbi:iron-containing alcohol dehydrogenase [Curvivirga aplysinae]|uniref:iron-containing alcohol dehydrogenase n=1 Tax=Curvivirga aplysinae TaxID=2529852 RepID=UPI0012BBC4C6|nr:iron-containing alcohol dehydrogenase [Curvivirga aplysinae]MTI08521.1 iron-containing alcohol dehydrogenase [Curvivirga aplysinae]
MTLTANWGYPTAIRFGAGRIQELAAACTELGMKNPLLVTDKGLASLPITASTMDVLKNAGVEAGFFGDVMPNPDDVTLEAGLKLYKENGHDGVICFGGGSALDLGKIIAFMSGQTRPVWDFEDIGDWWTRADPDGIAPIIAVPTTAGTGSEVGRAGLLTDTVNHIKKIIFHPKMLPAIVICDPELTVGMPPVITAGTGLDAFVHSFEAYSSPVYHPMSQGIALEGMRLVKDNLLRAYKDGEDIEARAHMMSAAAMGATAFQKGLGAVHALAHPLGAVYNTPHGMTNAIALPAVMRFNRPAIEERVERLAAYLNIKGGFDGFYDWIVEFSEAMEVPKSMKALGVDDKQIDLLAKMAVEDPSAGGNPIELTVEVTTKLYQEIII